jgi:hypothetical protein
LISTENNTAKQSLIPVFCVRLLLIALPHLVVFGSLNDGAFASAAKPASYAYGSTVYDRVQVSVKTLRDSVVATARRVGMKDIPTIEEEKRIVNRKEVLYLLIEGDFKSVPMVFLYSLHSSKSGTVQLSAFTLKRLFGRYRADIADFMNGLELYE